MAEAAKDLITIDPVTSLTMSPGIIGAMRLVSQIVNTRIVSIKSDEQELQYSQMLVQTRQILKTAETERKAAVDPLNRAVRSVNDWIKTHFSNPITDKEREIQTAVRAWRFKKAEAQRKQEEKARKLQGQMQAKADRAGLDIAIPAIVPPTPQKITRVDGGQVHERKQWVCEIMNKAEIIKAVAAGSIPSDVLDPNITIIRNLTKSGINIPGVKAGYETALSVRSA